MANNSELMQFLRIVALTLCVSVPIILSKIRLPRRLQVATLTDDQLTDKQREFLGSFDSKLKDLGYTPFITYRLANIPGSKNLLRSYLSGSDPTRCTVQISAAGGGPVQFDQVQFVTEFADKTRTFTTNRTNSQTFDVEPERYFQQCPGIRDLAELKRRHEQFTDQYRFRGPVFMDTKNFLAQTQEQYDREVSHQVKQKLLRLDAAKDEYRVTLKWALRMQFNFFNPFADGFTVPKLMGALAIAALPVLARLHEAQFTAGLASSLGVNFGWMPVVTVSYLVAGVGAGLLFGHKSFVSAFLLAYIPTLFLPSGASHALGMSLLTAWVAFWTYQVRGYAKRVV